MNTDDLATKQKRLDEILGLLNAYRQQWISWDLADVRRLRAEAMKLKAEIEQ